MKISGVGFLVKWHKYHDKYCTLNSARHLACDLLALWLPLETVARGSAVRRLQNQFDAKQLGSAMFLTSYQHSTDKVRSDFANRSIVWYQLSNNTCTCTGTVNSCKGIVLLGNVLREEETLELDENRGHRVHDGDEHSKKISTDPTKTQDNKSNAEKQK